MPNFTPSMAYNMPSSLRMVIALLFGLQFGLLAFYRASSPIWLWVPCLPVLILLSAIMLSIWYDPHVRSREINADQVLQGLVRFLIVIVIPVFIMIITFFFVHSIGALVLALIPLTLGVLTTFTIVGNQHRILAVVYGLLSWVGVGLPFLLSSYLTSQQPGNDLGRVAFLLLTFGVITGFLFAALGGYLGRLLRRWVLG